MTLNWLVACCCAYLIVIGISDGVAAAGPSIANKDCLVIVNIIINSIVIIIIIIVIIR